MPTEVWRPGDYRVCPTCGARHKIQDIKCARCKTVLVGTRVHHAAPVPVTVAAARSSRSLRAVGAVGLVVALGAGLWVRSVFRDAALQDTVEASSTAAAMPRAPEPTWQPPVLSYPPVVGYNTGVPPSMAALTIHNTPPADAPSTGMTSIAPPSEPTRKTVFTDDDLMRVRAHDEAPAVPHVAAAAAVTTASAPAPPAAASAAVGIPSATIAATAARAVAVPSEEAREWISRLHDRQEDVHAAQAKVRRLEVQAESRRAAVAAAADPDARVKAERDLMDDLDDLEKAERKLAKARREMDETQEQARQAGVRLER
jgi:hypothetical protein